LLPGIQSGHGIDHWEKAAHFNRPGRLCRDRPELWPGARI
jgi:hypothetical protein